MADDDALPDEHRIAQVTVQHTVVTKNEATLAFMAKPDGDFAIELVYNWVRGTPYDGGERFGHFASRPTTSRPSTRGCGRPAERTSAGRPPRCRAKVTASPSSPTPTATGSNSSGAEPSPVLSD